MSKFVQRLSAPSKSDKHYYSDNIFYQCGYGMPNCTAYAWGRWYELLGTKPKLYTGNAKTWYPKGESYDGYKRGQTPKLGAVACWSSSGAGHVAIVEKIYSDGTILTSNSAWKSTNFYTKEIKKGYNFGSYKFQGFIYLPMEFEEETTTQETYKVGTTYTTQVILKVRSGAGTNYAQKTYNQLTPNAKAHAYSTGANAGCLKAGTKVTCQEIRQVGNDTWIRIPSGWIASIYNGKTYVK